MGIVKSIIYVVWFDILRKIFENICLVINFRKLNYLFFCGSCIDLWLDNIIISWMELD